MKNRSKAIVFLSMSSCLFCESCSNILGLFQEQTIYNNIICGTFYALNDAYSNYILEISSADKTNYELGLNIFKDFGYKRDDTCYFINLYKAENQITTRINFNGLEHKTYYLGKMVYEDLLGNRVIIGHAKYFDTGNLYYEVEFVEDSKIVNIKFDGFVENE